MNLIENWDARERVLSKLASAERLLNMAPGTKGRLPISFGIERDGSVPHVAVSCDTAGVWRFYDESIGGGGLVHEQYGSAALSAWAKRQQSKFRRQPAR